ncbi:TetR/AcrR family transcriptional regulator [Reinekea forsetii]|nr:TetR/AcrR family transcriptional regulator [Reinekea forsetii]
MAQPSKKDHIALSARPLFFEHGIKGTSVDMVVKASKVSKPTVYNHFPDKSALFYHVVSLWLAQQSAASLTSSSEKVLIEELKNAWLHSEAITFYRLIIGEGNRAVEATQLFKQHYDAVWRADLKDWCAQQGIDALRVEDKVSHYLLNKLMA